MLIHRQINRYVSVGALKHYFNVTTPYVLRKLLLVLFPWRHKPWSRQQRPSTTSGAQDSASYSYYFLPPRDDLNSPDMYIPVMAFVTYILLSTLLAGLRGAFHPEVMGLTATTAFIVVVLEILGLKFGTYILSISNDSQLLDLVAYSGYKFVGVIVTLVVSEILNRGAGTGGWVGWTIFTYTFLANAFFLVNLLVPIPHKNQSVVLNRFDAAPLPQIRSPARLLILHPSRQRHANRRALPTQPADAILVPLLVHCAIRLHVDTQSAGQRDGEGGRGESLMSLFSFKIYMVTRFSFPYKGHDLNSCFSCDHYLIVEQALIEDSLHGLSFSCSFLPHV